MIADTIDLWDAALNAWFASLGAPVEGLTRLCLAGVFGGVVGLEREIRGRAAGFRTYLLVCMGSALVMLVSVHFAREQWPQTPGVNLNIDPARIAYGVMTGVGFLGAGTIVQNGGSIRGLTTAAGLWCVAAVGLAVGHGMYSLSLLSTLLIVAALWVLDYVEEMVPKVRYRTVTVRVQYRIGCIADTVSQFQKSGVDIVDASLQRSEDMKWADIDLRVAFTSARQYYEIEREIEAHPGYELVGTREV